MEEKLLSISVQINILESLSRILLEIIREGENLKKFDSGNLAKIILNEVIKIKEEMNMIESELGI